MCVARFGACVSGRVDVWDGLSRVRLQLLQREMGVMGLGFGEGEAVVRDAVMPVGGFWISVRRNGRWLEVLGG